MKARATFAAPIRAARRFLVSILALAAVLSAVSATAAPAARPLDAAARAALQEAAQQVLGWGTDPALVRAVREQNARQATLAQIRATDRAWTAGAAQAEVERLLESRCALRLKALVASARYLEATVMDAQGANVCMSAKTPDYWQGDEAQWQKAFDAGRGAVFVDEVRHDTRTRNVLVQISVPVRDGSRVIGALTVGVSPYRSAAAAPGGDTAATGARR
jgi:hypothetical protein